VKRQGPAMPVLCSLAEPLLGLEELEARLEQQLMSMPVDMDDDTCLYFLCTTRCSGVKCPVYCPCDIVLDFGG
jgi:hypothetical protein